jgi:Intracellular septation protein A
MDQNNNLQPPRRMNLLKMIFNREFVVSAVIPLIVFYVFDSMGMVLTGTIVSGAWCVLIVIIGLVRDKKINFIALLSAIFSAIGLVGTIISQSPRFYMASPIICDLILALVFIGSIFFPRPVLQAAVENTWGNSIPMKARGTQEYKSMWKILSIGWGIISLIQAVLRTILLYSVSVELYYGISTVYSNVTTPLFIVLSFTLPKWYLKRKRLNKNNNLLEVK